jgi:hypothetical protein
LRPKTADTIGGFMERLLSDPTIACPQCGREIKLNESLAAPLLESTRREFEQRLTAKDAEIAARAAALKSEADRLESARAGLDEQVRLRTQAERANIAADEARKARQAVSVDMEQQAKETAELKDVLKAREQKLAEAAAAQAELIRAKRELDDQKREMALTIETRIQKSLGDVRAQARTEAEQKLAAVVEAGEKSAAVVKAQLADVAKREAAIETAKAAAEKQNELARKQLADQLQKDRVAIAAEEADRARAVMSAELDSKAKELAEVQANCAGQEIKLAEAQKAQAESIRKQRELDEARRELDLTIEKRVGENLTAAYDKARRDVEDAINLKLAEKDHTIKTMQDRIEE